MKNRFRSGTIGLAVGLTVAAAGAQAAVQATQHQQADPSAQKPAPDAMKGMKDMHAMMGDPAMRQKMMTNMAQCRDMMSMMMEHMKQEGEMRDAKPAPKKQ